MDFGVVKGIARGVMAATLAIGIGAVGLNLDASAQEGDARVRIVHASPDAPAVDIWVNGEVAVPDLAFGEDTGVISLPAGTYDVAVAPAGAAPEDAVIEATLDLPAGSANLVAAVGYLDEIEAQIYPMDLSPLGEGEARVRIIHASPDAPAVTVTASGAALATDLAFPNASEYATVPADAYDVVVSVAESGDTVLEVPGFALEAGQVYDVMAIGEAGAGTLAPLPLAAAADTATGGETAAAAGTTDSGTTDAGATGGEVTATPATGIGSTVATSSMLGMMLLAATAFLFAAGAYRFELAERIRNRS